MSADVMPTLFLILKGLVILAFFIYAVFAFIMVRQEHLMATVLEEKYEPVLRVLTLIHFALSIGLILLAVLIL